MFARLKKHGGRNWKKWHWSNCALMLNAKAPNNKCQVPNNKSQIPKKYQLQVNPKTVE